MSYLNPFRSGKEKPSPTSPAEWERGEIWWEDGNIILHCGRKAFKVYAGILLSRAPGFKALVNSSKEKNAASEDPPPYGSPGLEEGIPNVNLDLNYNCPPEDMEHFLLTVFDASHLSDDLPIAKVVAIARLGHRYEAKAVKKACLLYLDNLLPITLFQAELHYAKAPRVVRGTEHPTVILLAEELGWKWLIPFSSYLASIESMHCRLGSWDGNRDVFERTMVGGRTQAAQFHMVLYAAYSTLGEKQCPSKQTCDAARLASIKKLNDDCLNFEGDTQQQKLLKMVRLFDPLRFVTRRFWGEAAIEWLDDGLCGACKGGIQTTLEEKKRQIWDGLPQTFQVGENWAELAKLREKTMKDLS